MPQEATPLPAEAPRIVLDTNVLLDALVFGDASMLGWLDALRRGQITAVASASTWAEWLGVVRRPLDARWNPAREQALTSGLPFELLMMPEPTTAGSSALTCSDPDDQKFIDLALASQARWLLTRDRALLRLARAAAVRGLTVLRPSDTQPD